MKKGFLFLSLLLTIFINSLWSQGFYISGNQLRDANGNNFIMKGFAVPLAWFVSDVKNNIANMRNKTGANCMRIVVTTSTVDADWQAAVNTCIANKVVPMVELHDVTCINDWNRLNDMAKFWASKAWFLTSSSVVKYILINIANEWGDGSQSNSNWRDAYKAAITTMRNAGINTTLVVDAPGCGQDYNNATTMRTYWSDLQNYDPKHNLLFSVHMYGVWCPGGSSTPSTGITAMRNSGMPFIVGEFADQGSFGNLDEVSVMNTCANVGAGWLAWSWKGNSEPILDMSNDWAGTSLTTWGNTVVWGNNGTKTATTCSVFGSGCTSTAITPYLQINGGTWQQTAYASVAPGTQVVLGPQPSSGGSWNWNGGCGTSGTSREQTIYPTGDCDILVTYTNSCGAQSSYTYQIRMSGPAAIVSGGTYTLTARHSGKVLDVTGSGTTNGTNVEQWTNYNASNQQWVITDVGNGYFRVSPANATGEALDVSGNGTADGTNVQIWNYGGGTNQQWQFVPNGSYFNIKDRNSGKCLDVSGVSTADGANVQIWTCGGGYNQQWSLSRLKSEKVDVEVATIKPLGEVQIYPNPSDGNFKIEGVINGTAEVYDLNGQLLLTKVINATPVSIESGLSKGIYIVKITSQNKVTTSKLVIQ